MDKMKVLNMLNNKYYLYKNDLLGGRPNPYAMGNAWFVQNIKSVKGADEEILAIKETDALKKLEDAVDAIHENDKSHDANLLLKDI